MAPLSTKLTLIGALLFLISSSAWVGAEDDAAMKVDNVVELQNAEPSEEDLYVSPSINAEWVYFSEHFDDEQAFNKKWIRSEAKKQDVEENIAKYDGIWKIQAPTRKILKNDLGLVLLSEAKHAAISALLDRPFEFKDKPLVVQYELTLQDLLSCGGSYIKLLSKGSNTKADLRKFHDQTPYTIMFGPDKCGTSNKIHFIFRHVNPVNNSIEEKHCKKHTSPIDHLFSERSPHLLRLVLRPDNTYSIYLDQKEVNFGNLLEDFMPPVNPPEEIDDPNDQQPADWDSREKIPDPLAVKPEDWDENAPATIPDPNAVKPDGWLEDEPENIPDPNAVKPDDWDEDMDGEWEAPLIDNLKCTVGCGPWKQPTIPNPNYKGPWHAPMIPNPDYKGQWTAKRIPNPYYFKDDHPFKLTPIHAVGFELWSMTPNILFDNIIITDDESVADMWTEQTYALKKNSIIRNSESFLDRVLHFTTDHPWVYVVVIIVAFIFIAAWVYCCYNVKSDPEGDEDAKKTDALLEDDPHLSDGEEEPQEVPRGKAKLEEQPDSTLDAEPEQPQPAQAAFVDADAAGDGQRKRKPRKE